jgi:hypothetical protein
VCGAQYQNYTPDCLIWPKAARVSLIIHPAATCAFAIADKGNQQAMFQANYYKKPKFRFVADQNHKICNCAEMVSAHAYLPEHGSNFAEMNAPIVPIRTSRGQTSRRIPPKVELNYCTIAQYYGRFASLPPCVRIW